jgi:hypothetical protein
MNLSQIMIGQILNLCEVHDSVTMVHQRITAQFIC